MGQRKSVVAGALGECVHVAGVTNFLRRADPAGWRTVFLGPSMLVEEVIEAGKCAHTVLICVSYRLRSETGERLLGEFAEATSAMHEKDVHFAFGGTPL